MSIKVIQDQKCAKVTLDSDLSIVKVVWNLDCSSEDYRTTYLKIIDFQRTQQVDFFISDVRDQRVVSPEDRKWFETAVLPTAIKQGLKRAAVITNANVFKKYYLNLILSATNKFGLPLKLVQSEAEALEFLNQS